MTPEESKKLDSLCEKVAEIHDVFYRDPGLVHEVKVLCEWRKSVKTNITWFTRIVIALILSSCLGALIFFWSNK